MAAGGRVLRGRYRVGWVLGWLAAAGIWAQTQPTDVGFAPWPQRLSVSHQIQNHPPWAIDRGQHWRLLLVMAFRVVTWNPMSLVRGGRQELIAEELKNIDGVIMMGTKIRQPNTMHSQVIKKTIEGALVLDWGYSDGANLSNRSCGTRLQLRGDRYKASNVIGLWSPPKSLQGRGGAARVRSKMLDFVLMGLYFPPRPHTAKEKPMYEKIVQNLVRWATDTLVYIRSKTQRTMITVGMDLNDDAEGEGLAAVKLREMLEQAGLVIANTSKEHTWYGNNTSSRIDYMAISSEKMPAVQRCGVTSEKGRVLQMVDTPVANDHIPIQLTMKYKQAKPVCATPPPLWGVDWDRQQLTQEALKGTSRKMLLESLDERMKDLHFGGAHATADEAWNVYVQAVQDAITDSFPKTEKQGDPSYQAMMQRRRDLVAKVGSLKRRLADLNDFEAEKIVSELREVSKRCSRMSRSWWAKKRDELGDELRDFHNSRPTAVAYSICRRLAATGAGKGKIYLNVLPASRPSSKEWQEYLAQEGPKGGMTAETIDYELEVEGIKGCQDMREVTGQNLVQAERDKGDIAEVILRMKMHKAAPPWDVPTEAWRIILHPGLGIDTSKRGLGFEKYEGENLASKRLVEVLAIMRATQWAPCAWHRSKGVGIDKKTANSPALESASSTSCRPWGELFTKPALPGESSQHGATLSMVGFPTAAESLLSLFRRSLPGTSRRRATHSPLPFSTLPMPSQVPREARCGLLRTAWRLRTTCASTTSGCPMLQSRSRGTTRLRSSSRPLASCRATTAPPRSSLLLPLPPWATG